MGGCLRRYDTETHHKSGFHCSFACRLATKTKLTVYTTFKLHPPQTLKKEHLPAGKVGIFTSQYCLRLTISVAATNKTEKNPCRIIFSAEAVKDICCRTSLRPSTSYIQRNFQTHSVLLPVKPCCTDLGIGLRSLKFPFLYLPLINNWGWPWLRRPPTAKCEISA